MFWMLAVTVSQCYLCLTLISSHTVLNNEGTAAVQSISL